MYQYRVTKYDPAFRDAAGAYTREEWTAFSDIGRLFGTATLSTEDYLRIESAYIDIATRFLAEDGAPSLCAIGVENHKQSVLAPIEGSLIPAQDLPKVCRSILREQFWCRLEADGRFIHFGYDYYMYVGVKSRCADTVSVSRALGLFVEPFDSPYQEEKSKAIYQKHCGQLEDCAPTSLTANVLRKKR